jgi:hypothetical protein
VGKGWRWSVRRAVRRLVVGGLIVAIHVVGYLVAVAIIRWYGDWTVSEIQARSVRR